MPLTPHITAKSANLLVILHAESSLAYALEVGGFRFFHAESTSFLLLKTEALGCPLAFRHGATVFQFLLFHLGNFNQPGILQPAYREELSASDGQNEECGSGLFRYLPSG